MSLRNDRGQAPAVTAMLLAVLGLTLVGAAPQRHRSSDRGRASLRFASGLQATIPIVIEGNHIGMRGRLQGKDSIWVDLDTGAGGSAMDSGRAAVSGFVARGSHESRGAGGTVRGSTVSDVRLELPGLEILQPTMGTLPLDPIGAQGGREMDVILGYPLFNNAVVEVDYASRLLRVYDPDSFVYRGDGVSVPIELIQNLPYVTARLTLQGREPVEEKFVIDTGSSMALILGPEFVEKERALETVQKTMTISGRGVGGASINPIGRVARFELGGYELEQPTATFRGKGPGVIGAPGTMGNVGGMIMRRFKVIFDYPRKRMILEPNQQLHDPFEADMSGLGLTTDLPDYRVIRVLRVADNTPAAEVGLRVGDQIEQVDGRPASEIGVATLRDWFRRDGVAYRLGIRRGEEKLEVTLTTRRMI